MSGRRRGVDPSLSAARYRQARDAQDDEPPAEPGWTDARQRASFVEITIQQAMRRGEFDDLPGKGRPLPGLGGRWDPDWWIRRKVEREGLTGLGPPGVVMRREDAALNDRLDGLPTEAEVRAAVQDFNSRLRTARLRPPAGPPLITRTRDVEAEVVAWRERADQRRAAATRAAQAARERRDAEIAALPWWRRGRARRALG